MVGRAGRYGYDLEADSYICVPKSKVSEKKNILKLMCKDKLEYIESCFCDKKLGLSRLIFDSIGTKLVTSEDQIK